MTDRWPPVYDADDLARCITEVVSASDSQGMYSRAGLSIGPAICQGDIVELPASVPVIDSSGAPAILEAAPPWWLVIGNTCDFVRSYEDVPWTQLVPVWELDRLDDVDPSVLNAFRGYQYARRFYLPPWPGSSHLLRYADFLTPVGADRGAMREHASVIARTSREGWVLLHSCLVRFLCRDDGRFEGAVPSV